MLRVVSVPKLQLARASQIGTCEEALICVKENKKYCLAMQWRRDKRVAIAAPRSLITWLSRSLRVSVQKRICRLVCVDLSNRISFPNSEDAPLHGKKTDAELTAAQLSDCFDSVRSRKEPSYFRLPLSKCRENGICRFRKLRAAAEGFPVTNRTCLTTLTKKKCCILQPCRLRRFRTLNTPQRA